MPTTWIPQVTVVHRCPRTNSCRWPVRTKSSLCTLLPPEGLGQRLQLLVWLQAYGHWECCTWICLCVFGWRELWMLWVYSKPGFMIWCAKDFSAPLHGNHETQPSRDSCYVGETVHCINQLIITMHFFSLLFFGAGTILWVTYNWVSWGGHRGNHWLDILIHFMEIYSVCFTLPLTLSVYRGQHAPQISLKWAKNDEHKRAISQKH